MSQPESRNQTQTPSVELTPMMRQYLEIKAQYPDAILFFRLGDFYEMFLDDAIKASRILDITLTSRGKGGDGSDIPLCGVPYHSATPYLAKLIEAGEKVAICEQVEDPKSVKGIVRREVVRVVTPGLVMDGENLAPKENNYLLCLVPQEAAEVGLAYLDLSTGEFRVTELSGIDAAIAEIACVKPREILLPVKGRDTGLLASLGPLGADCLVSWLEEWVFDPEYARRLFQRQFAAHPESMGCGGMRTGVKAAASILHYLYDTQKGEVAHIRELHPYQTREFLVLDESTRRNLELTATMAEGKRRGSLLGLLDKTVTAMGGRKLKQWINYPLAAVEPILERQDAVDELFRDPALRMALAEALEGVYDLERLNGRISMASASAKDLAALRVSLERIPLLLSLLSSVEALLLQRIHEEIDPLEEVTDLIRRGVVDNPPFILREGGIIAEGYHAELDELRAISREGKGFIARLEAQERARTGIGSLKIRYNKVFGYYIEVTRRVMHREAFPLPAWSDLGVKFVTGFKYSVVIILYALPVILLAIPMMVLVLLASMSDPGGTPGVFASVYVFAYVLLAVPYSLLLMLLTPVIAYRFAERERMSDALDIGSVIRAFRHNWESTTVVALIAAGVQMFSGMGVFALLVGVFFTLFYAYLVTALLHGHLYLDHQKRQEAVAV